LHPEPAEISAILLLEEKNGGIVLALRRASSVLGSPQAGLTSEFEMGSGVTLPLKTPPKLRDSFKSRIQTLEKLFIKEF
jgi:hypothetical protein